MWRLWIGRGFTSAADPAADSAAARIPARAAFWLRVLLFVAGTTVLLMLIERPHYLRTFSGSPVRLASSEKSLLKWLLWWKSAVLFVPVLAAVGFLTWRRWFRSGAGLLLAFWLAVFSWLVMDLKVQQLAGTHALDLLPYLYDALSDSAAHLQWGGDLRGSVQLGALMQVLVIAAGIAGWQLTKVLVCPAAHRWPRLAGFNAAVATLLAAGGLLAAWPLAGKLSPFVLRQFRQRLPYDLVLLDYGPTWGAAAAGVQIVAVLPNPAGSDSGKQEVHFHNFSRWPISLENWELRNKAGQRLPLAGRIEPDQKYTLNLPPRQLALSKNGDTVQLYCRGRRIHAVRYRANEVKYARLIQFRDATQYGAFERQVNLRCAALYEQVFPWLRQPRPPEREARFQRPDAPNVICIVLESFREQAVGPRLMANLDAWGRQGLRLRRHYAGTNSSHLGLFTLLYSRPAIAYEPTLDAGLEPQTTASLRASGYQCHFVTSGNCLGFRRMGEYLRMPFFDSIHQRTGQSFREWPELDMHALEKVRRLATATPDRPQFILCFLMSTHFPYAFPREFDVHQPSGDGIDRSNWTNAEQSVIRNRYANAALFLERQILQLARSLDPRKNIIIVTGDHGESLGEDGGLAHATRPSDIQMRVPFLMVGPGVPQREVVAATTHLDVLPTLLHVLAGAPLPLAHSAGRDLWEADPPDQVLLWPYRYADPREIVLIRGEQRLQFRVHFASPRLEVYGFTDERGDLLLELRDDYSPAAAADWAAALGEELQAAAGKPHW